MNVVPASQSSPVSTFISMSWRGRGSIIGVLVLTNCCSVVLVPAPFEEYSVSSAQQSAGVSEARTTATPLLSSSSTSPSLVHMAHDHQFDVSLFILVLLLFLAAHPRGGSMCFTYWHCLARPSVVPISLRSLGFRFVSALVRYITLGAYSNHGPVRLLSGAGRHGRT